MDDKAKELEQIKADYIDKQRRLALLDAGIDYNDVSTYVKYIKATSNAEIKQQAAEIAADINQQSQLADVYIDKHVWKPF